MKTYLHQAPRGPRWVLELDYNDTLTPEIFERVCAEGLAKWQIPQMILLWHLRPPSELRLTLRVNMRDALQDPPGILLELARKAVRNAIRNHCAELLPAQFHHDDSGEPTGLLGPDGRPLTR